MTRICFMGFGEVGQKLAADLHAHERTAWDILFASPQSAPAKAAGALAARDAQHALNGADLVISAVTAAQTVRAAEMYAPALAPGAFYLDLNSASPAAKQDAARIIAASGARYVEAAVMSPIAPKGLATPMLLGGPHAQAFLGAGFGFDGARFYAEAYGRAAAAKLCRSVIVKGMEALLTESLVAARFYGVEDDVITSLGDLFPGHDWREKSRYMISRALEHGVRRAEEMREAARTVTDASVAPLMSEACAERQDWAAALKAAYDEPDLAAMLDMIRTRLTDAKLRSAS